MFYFVTACPGDSFLLYSMQMRVFLLRLTWVTMVIAATRMHRSLTNFVCGSADVYDVLNFLTFSCSLQQIMFSAQGDLVQNSSPPVQRTERLNAGSTQMNRMDVVVHTVSEQHGILRVRDDDSCTITDGQMHGIPNGLSCDHEGVGRAV